MSKDKVDFSKLSTEELLKDIETAKMEYDQLRLEHTIREVQNPSVFKEMRKDIARRMTIVRQRELESPEVLEKRSRIRLRRSLNK